MRAMWTNESKYRFPYGRVKLLQRRQTGDARPQQTWDPYLRKAVRPGRTRSFARSAFRIWLRACSSSAPVHPENNWLFVQISQLSSKSSIHEQCALGVPHSVGAVYVTEDMQAWALLDYGSSEFGVPPN